MADDDGAPGRQATGSPGIWIVTVLAIVGLLGLCVGLALIAASRA